MIAWLGALMSGEKTLRCNVPPNAAVPVAPTRNTKVRAIATGHPVRRASNIM